MPKQVLVTTGDLKEDYDIIGPVYFQVSNKGIFSSALSDLVEKYSRQIQKVKDKNLISAHKRDWGFLYGEWSTGQNQFEKAFFVAVEELKERARIFGANAIICMRQDIDLDTNAFQFFYLQIYGTAVKLKREIEEIDEDSIDEKVENGFEICPNCGHKSSIKFNICENCCSSKH